VHTTPHPLEPRSQLEVACAGEDDPEDSAGWGRQSGRRGRRPRASGIGKEAGEAGTEVGEEGELLERPGWSWHRVRERIKRSSAGGQMSGDGSFSIAMRERDERVGRG
jgi:hypothetical protein